MKHKVTAIIYNKRGHVLSVGQNSYIKTHPRQAKFAKEVGEDESIFLHAEIAAIIKCQDLDSAHTIKVFRYNAKGEPVNAKPCAICQSALAKTPIRKIIHT